MRNELGIATWAAIPFFHVLNGNERQAVCRCRPLRKQAIAPTLFLVCEAAHQLAKNPPPIVFENLAARKPQKRSSFDLHRIEIASLK